MEETNLNGLRCFNGDCLELMGSMPDKSVDFILTDIPYELDLNGGGRSWRLYKPSFTAATQGKCDILCFPRYRLRQGFYGIYKGVKGGECVCLLFKQADWAYYDMVGKQGLCCYVACMG